jgi:serine/threonine kinase PknH
MTDEARTIGGYRLGELLGRGSSGRVQRATRLSDGMSVAMKLLRPELADDEQFVRRFKREAATAAELDHPNLVRVLDAGEADGELFLVAEHMPGGSLRDLLSGGRMVPDGALQLAARIASALACLHGRGIVHRDVKPSNVMLDAAGEPRLTDFGLAKVDASRTLTRPGQVLGTLGYMAPELIEGADATAAADLYALACVTFECLTGHPPFVSDRLIEVAVAHVCTPPEDPRSMAPGISEAQAVAVLSGLAKRPADRPASAAAYASVLQAAVRPPQPETAHRATM